MILPPEYERELLSRPDVTIGKSVALLHTPENAQEGSAKAPEVRDGKRSQRKPRNAPKRVPNKTEARYGAYLESQMLTGEILWWKFEPIRLKLADGATYKPDFLYEDDMGVLVCVEIKGFPREAALVRFRVARELYPIFKFRMVRWHRGAWEDIL